MNFDFCLILTCTINPGDMPDLIRNNINIRLSDYKKSFKFWVSNKNISKIVLIENSNYDLSYFRDIAKNLSKKIEIISSNSNNTFQKSLGKGFGQYLCLKEVFERSLLVKNVDYFIDITGRHCIKNFNKILDDIVHNRSDIYINLSDNLKFADTNIYGGSKKFFTQYLIPEISKTNDLEKNIFENCAAKAVLKAVADGLTLSKTPIYADIDGYIGTNGKKYKQNFFKKIKLFFFRKLKSYFFSHKKY